MQNNKNRELLTQNELISLYLHVCHLDMQALKPGNVGLHANSHDLSVEDFISSAEASAKPLLLKDISLGERIFVAVKATREAVATNTNLGIIMLIAPLVQAYLSATKSSQSMQSLVAEVLQETTVEDAKRVYQAIRLAEPGGMGERDDQDLSEEPDVSLLNTMKIAQSWDRIAAQYSNNYVDIFEYGVPRYKTLIQRWEEERWAVTGVFLGYLSRYPDSLIKRKFGVLKAKEISDMITPLERELCRSDTPGWYEAQLMEIDSHLKRNRINPGTSADLTIASIFAAAL